MAYTNSPRGQLLAVNPDAAEDPNIVADLLNIIAKLEPRIVLRANDLANANATLGPFENGMWLSCLDGKVYQRVAGVWQKRWPFYSWGPTAPVAATMDVGDFYFQHA